MKKLNGFLMLMLIVMAMSFVIACGGDDDDTMDGDVTDGDTTDGDTVDGDTEDGDVEDGDTTDGDSDIEALMTQAVAGCVEYWDTACGYDWSESDVEDSAAFCQAWVDAYAPTMEQFAAGMDMECMGTVMNGFFECMGESCDPDTAWSDCNGQVQAEMMGCFTE